MTGCNIKLDKEQDSFPLKVIKDNDLPQLVVKLKGQRCNIVYTKSKFLKCNETWIQLNGLPEYQKIGIAFISKVGNSNNYNYHIAVSINCYSIIEYLG